MTFDDYLDFDIDAIDSCRALIHEQPAESRGAIAFVLNDASLLPPDAPTLDRALDGYSSELREQVRDARRRQIEKEVSRRDYFRGQLTMVTANPAKVGLLSTGESCAVAVALGREVLLPPATATIEAALERLEDWLRVLVIEEMRLRLGS